VLSIVLLVVLAAKGVTLEKEAIVKALEKTRRNKTAVAKELGITFRAFIAPMLRVGMRTNSA